jgi:hypothetical protein
MTFWKSYSLSMLSFGVSAYASPQPVNFLSYYGSIIKYLGKSIRIGAIP